MAVEASINHDTQTRNTVRWTSFLAIIGGFVLAATGQDIKSYSFLFTELAVFIGAFVYSRVAAKNPR